MYTHTIIKLLHSALFVPLSLPKSIKLWKKRSFTYVIRFVSFPQMLVFQCILLIIYPCSFYCFRHSACAIKTWSPFFEYISISSGWTPAIFDIFHKMEKRMPQQKAAPPNIYSTLVRWILIFLKFLYSSFIYFRRYHQYY